MVSWFVFVLAVVVYIDIIMMRSCVVYRIWGFDFFIA